jgi:hypothetical protein
MSYPVDQARTARAHAGETPKITGGLVAVALAAVALGAELYELTFGDVRIGLAAAIFATVSSVAGLGWLNHLQRRVRGAQPQLVARGPNAPAPWPGR